MPAGRGEPILPHRDLRPVVMAVRPIAGGATRPQTIGSHLLFHPETRDATADAGFSHIVNRFTHLSDVLVGMKAAPTSCAATKHTARQLN